MDCMGKAQKPHAVFVPFPAQGHINPMFKLAILLHHKDFHITFVNTEYNHKRLVKSRGSSSLTRWPDFCFKSIPDGLPPTDIDGATQDIPSLCDSIRSNCLAPFRELLDELNDTSVVPAVACVISDVIMSFCIVAGEEIGVPVVCFRPTNAVSFMCNKQCSQLIQKGLVPFKDASYVTNGYLDTIIDWIPGMIDIRLKDFPSYIRTTDRNDLILNFIVGETDRVTKASALIFNTFDSLEPNVLHSLSSLCPPIYTIGPVHLLINKIPQNSTMDSIGSNLWEEELDCLQWLNLKEPNSVLYVNFGSITVVTQKQFIEFAWGLSNSEKNFLWIIRDDLVSGDSAILPPEFMDCTKGRGLISKWCPQEEVLSHSSIGGFLTHCGWNSIIESLSSGVPMVCWPFFADQLINCKYLCSEWGVGLEIDSNVKRDVVEKLVRELMDGEKGKKMKKNAMEWKKRAEEATGKDGSSYLNLDKLMNEVLLSKFKP